MPKKFVKTNGPKVGDKSREVLANLDEGSSTIMLFREYSAGYDDKNDRHERIHKINRDITIESKRIIFLLHTPFAGITGKKESVLEEASNRLDLLVNTKFRVIAQELDGHEGYQYLKAYTAGMQEFLEALQFYEYLKNGTITNMIRIKEKFTYTEEHDAQAEECAGKSTEEKKPLSLLVTQLDYVMGLADFTGELMRKCINNLGGGQIDDCYSTCKYVNDLHCGYLGVHFGNRELQRKIVVLRQSLIKMEMVCYNLRVRGSEIPTYMLALEDPGQHHNDDDEGFF